MGEFQKKFQDIANRTPLGILDELHKKHDVWIPDSFMAVVKQAKKEFKEKFYTGKEISFNHKTKEELFNYIIRKNQERDNWFEKWFGKADAEGE